MSEAMTTTTDTGREKAAQWMQAASSVKWGESGVQLAAMSDAWTFAERVAQSGIYKGVTTPAAALIKLQAGAELGLSPHASLSQIHLIEGTPVLSAHVMLARILACGGDFAMKRWDAQACEIEWSRIKRGQFVVVGPSTWTIEEARTANLTGKGNWQKHPTDMLRARGVARGARAYFPDLFVGGAYIDDEIDEIVVSRAVATPTRGEDAVRSKLAAKAEVADAEVVTVFAEVAAPVVEVAAADAPTSTKRTRRAKEPGEVLSVAASPAPTPASPTTITDHAHGATTSTTASVSVASTPASTSGELVASDPTPAPTHGASASTPTPSTSTDASASAPSSPKETAPPSSPAALPTSTQTGVTALSGASTLAVAIAEMSITMTSKELAAHVTSHQPKLSSEHYTMLTAMMRAVANRQKGFDIESGMDDERRAAFTKARAIRPNPIDD